MILLTWSLASLAPAYVLTIVGLAAFQRRLQYFLDRRLTELAQTGVSGGEDLRLTTADGETLVAWHFPARDGRRPVRRRGLMQDGEAAYREACTRGYDGDRIVLMGASLGTGVAIALAATHEAAALVLEAPYLSALDVASAHYAIFPLSWLMLDQFRSDLAIHDVHVPVLMVHGEEDDVIPLNSTSRLFELANAPKTFVSVPGGNHLVLGLADVFPHVCEWIDARNLERAPLRRQIAQLHEAPWFRVDGRVVFSSPVRTVEPQQSVDSGEIGRTMAEEIRTLKANVEATHAAQSLSAKDAIALGNLKTRLDAVKIETSAAIAEVGGKVEHLQRESAAKLSQFSDRFDRIEHQIATLLATASAADAPASGAAVARKRAQGGRSDAFDPSQNPTAPGAPRPLGSLAPSASVNNPAVENAYRQRTN